MPRSVPAFLPRRISVGPRFSGKVREERQRREGGGNYETETSAISDTGLNELAVELEWEEGVTVWMARHSRNPGWEHLYAITLAT